MIKLIYIGAGSTFASVFIDANKKQNVISPINVQLTCNNNKIIVIYPSSITFVNKPKMNSIDIPVDVTTVTKSGTQYTMISSKNNYNDNFNITI